MSVPSKVAALLLTAFLLIFYVEGCTSFQPAETAVSVPDKLIPGPKETLAMIVPAGGVQIYECQAKKDGGYEWGFVAPEADLYDAHGARVGSHYAGPTWESGDGSKIQGTVKALADSPEAGSIPWLLLTAKSIGPEGSYSNITSVQRLSTVGGVAPKDGCSATTAGTRARVSYTADYYFFAPRAAKKVPGRDFDAAGY